MPESLQLYKIIEIPAQDILELYHSMPFSNRCVGISVALGAILCLESSLQKACHPPKGVLVSLALEDGHSKDSNLAFSLHPS